MAARRRLRLRLLVFNGVMLYTDAFVRGRVTAVDQRLKSIHESVGYSS